MNKMGKSGKICIFAPENRTSMTAEDIKTILQTGENTVIEFKTCIDEVSNSLYESVCSFLNRSGGTILMGVDNDGTVIGVNPTRAESMIKDIVNTIQNSQVFLPTPYFTPWKEVYEGKTIIVMEVPVGLYVYRLKGRYWDRNNDADIDVTDSPELLLALFERKNPHLFEERFVQGMTEKDLDPDTFTYCRNIVKVGNPQHPWVNMSDWDILKSCGLVDKDSRNMKYAALLLFGNESALANYMPRYRYEGIFRMCTYGQYERMEDVSNRYDDRVTLRCNLIRVYDRLMEFIIRHLPDKFYLPPNSTQRLDLRIALFREILGNICVHADYSTGYACFLEIYKDYVITRNSSRLIPQIPEGNISIHQLGNYTKNPLLVKVFRELDWVEELGSGTRNILKYAPLYYSDYKISIQSGQQFLFAISYTKIDDGGENDTRSGSDDTRNLGNDTRTHSYDTRNNSHDVDLFEGVRQTKGIKQKKDRRREGIMSLIAKNRGVTTAELAEQLGFGTATIRRDLDFLCSIGILRRVGATKNGYWEILKKK